METKQSAELDLEAFSVVDLVKQILLSAIESQASDVHFEPYEQSYRIRYRQDGLLVEKAAPPLRFCNQLTSCIKVMANLDIAERRIPQDGHFNLALNERQIDCRVSTCPTISGEKVVIRLLEPHTTQLGLESLGLNSQQQQLFLNAINKPQGMILVTGPTGSGKTVSLYAALALLNREDKNIITIEDPVEIKLAGINQVNINQKAGLSFATALRAFLRQDPDVIMVGEIRDLETAEIAIQAAQTGHLVLSTLHTNSAAETLSRLTNIGISPFNIASSVHLLMAQRLARLLCLNCKRLHSDCRYQAQGCAACLHGYSGQIGLFELLPVSKTIGRLIMQGANSLEIHQQALQEGMLSMVESALEKVQQGLTTMEEVQRVVSY